MREADHRFSLPVKKFDETSGKIWLYQDGKGGRHLGWIADDAISLHEKWRCWRASQLEKRIIKALAEEGMSF